MRNIINVSLFVLALAVLLVVAAPPADVSASHSWGGYHWARTSNPFTLKLGDNVNNQWDPYLATTSSDWTQSTVLNTSIVPGKTRPRNCRPTAGRDEICNRAYGSNGWLGIAQIWINGLHITQGTVKVNDSYFDTAKYNTPAWRNLVMCQEVGHTFGLHHQDEDFNNPPLGTCMDYTSDPTPNQHPNQHDYDQLVAIYSHLDPTTTVNNMPDAVQNGEFDTPNQWGKLVSSARNGAHSTYERDFGNGFKVITHVTWAK